jgi:uncharacterized membrane protein YccC
VPRGDWLKDRSTSDLLVLVIAATICASVLMSGAVVAFLAITQPEHDHPAAVALVSDTLQMLVSLLAGFIAGRTEAATRPRKPEEGRPEREEKDHE